MQITRREIGSVLVLSFAEPVELEGDASARFRARTVEAVAEGWRTVVLDLGNVEFLDSSGLSALVSGLRAMHARGGELVLASVPERVRTVLEVTRLLKVFELSESAEEFLGERGSLMVRAGS